MSISAGEQIVQAMVNALNAPSPKPCTFYRTRIDALASEELPAGVLYSGEEESVPKTNTLMERTRKVNLELAVEGPPPADALLDALYVYAVQTLQADPTLGPLVRLLWDGRMQWDTEASIADVSVALVQFSVRYYTALQDPTVLITS